MYGGDLFAGGGYLWAMEAEENLRNQYLELLYKIAEKYRGNQVKKAIDTYKKIVSAFPYEEKAVLQIAALYHQLGQHEALHTYYCRYREMLKAELDVCHPRKVRQTFQKYTESNTRMPSFFNYSLKSETGAIKFQNFMAPS